jgi:hypothetical protein
MSILKNLKHILLLLTPVFIALLPANSLHAQEKPTSEVNLKFILQYETFKPLELKNCMLYVSPEKITGISDSLTATFSALNNFNDTIYINYPWKFPVHAFLKLYFANEIRVSNKFYLDPARKNYFVKAGDTEVIVKPQPRYSFNEKKSFLAIILVIQIALELLLAILFYKIFNWPKWIIIAVFVANLASLSVYLVKIEPLIWNEASIFLVKFLVLVLLGRRKLGFIKIFSLLIILHIISFGMKELMLLLSKLI